MSLKKLIFSLIFSLFCTFSFGLGFSNKIYEAGSEFLDQYNSYLLSPDVSDLQFSVKNLEATLMEYQGSSEFKKISSSNSNYSYFCQRILNDCKSIQKNAESQGNFEWYCFDIFQTLLNMNQAGSEYQNKVSFTFHLIIASVILVILIFIFILAMARKKIEYESKEKELNERLSVQIFEAQEQERIRISSELHDTIAQELKSCQLMKTEDLDKRLSSCVNQLRNICYNLTPPDLNASTNISTVLEFLCTNFTKKSGIECIFDSTLTKEENDFFNESDKILHIFRIVQEALNNIQQHSGAKNCSVVLRSEKNTISIFISDDGCGIPEENLKETSKLYTEKNHFGLRSMRNRAKLIGGELKIESDSNDGTVVIIKFSMGRSSRV